MGLAGRDPLFFAQMTNANQDVANVGTFCLRCHVPMSFVTGHAADPSGQTLDDTDRDGVTCHFCHSLVDPVYVPGQSPPEDEEVLAGLDAVPEHYGNAMFVLDPQGRRRGPYEETDAPHVTIASPFVKSSAMCGTCHDVGNVATWRRPDGSLALQRCRPAGDRREPVDPVPARAHLHGVEALGVRRGRGRPRRSLRRRARRRWSRPARTATCRPPPRAAASTAASATTSPATSSPAPPRSRST